MLQLALLLQLVRHHALHGHVVVTGTVLLGLIRRLGPASQVQLTLTLVGPRSMIQFRSPALTAGDVEAHDTRAKLGSSVPAAQRVGTFLLHLV